MKEGIILYQGSFTSQDDRTITVRLKKVGYGIDAKVTHLNISDLAASWRLDELIQASGAVVFTSDNSNLTYDEARKTVHCDYNNFPWAINMSMTFSLLNAPEKRVTITVTQAAAQHNLFVDTNLLEFDSNGTWKKVTVWSDTGSPYFTDPQVDWIFTIGTKTWNTAEMSAMSLEEATEEIVEDPAIEREPYPETEFNPVIHLDRLQLKPIKVFDSVDDLVASESGVDVQETTLTIGVKTQETVVSDRGGYGFDAWVYVSPNHMVNGEAQPERETTLTAKLDGQPTSVASQTLTVRQRPSESEYWIDRRFCQIYDAGSTMTTDIPLMLARTRNSVSLNMGVVPVNGMDYTQFQYELVDMGWGTDWVEIYGPQMVGSGSLRMPGFTIRFAQYDSEAYSSRFMMMRITYPDMSICDEIMIQQTSI